MDAAAFDLQRFVAAQGDGVYARAHAELVAGRKRSHWMWFVFPQLRGLGRSAMAHRYGIVSRAEAAAYAGDSLLGTRLRECARSMLAHGDKSALHILGTPDDVKLRSSMTLFAEVVADEALFDAVIATFYAGRRDEATLARLGAD